MIDPGIVVMVIFAPITLALTWVMLTDSGRRPLSRFLPRLPSRERPPKGMRWYEMQTPGGETARTMASDACAAAEQLKPWAMGYEFIRVAQTGERLTVYRETQVKPWTLR